MLQLHSRLRLTRSRGACHCQSLVVLSGRPSTSYSPLHNPSLFRPSSSSFWLQPLVAKYNVPCCGPSSAAPRLPPLTPFALPPSSRTLGETSCLSQSLNELLLSLLPLLASLVRLLRRPPLRLHRYATLGAIVSNMDAVRYLRAGMHLGPYTSHRTMFAPSTRHPGIK